MVNMELNIFKIKDEGDIDEIISKVKENAENKYMYRNLEKDIYIDKKAYNLKFFFYMNENQVQQLIGMLKYQICSKMKK